MHSVSPVAAILIDADNLHDAAWLDAVREQVRHRSGYVPMVRAYGSAAHLQSKEMVWRAVGAELVPNLALEKNTTDAGLIADAVELCCREGVRFFAIASGDADFAPLAVRLRRWGCEVWCFAFSSTLFKDADLYYDKVVRFERPAVPQPVVQMAKRAIAQAASSAAAVPAKPAPPAVAASAPCASHNRSPRADGVAPVHTVAIPTSALRLSVPAVLKACPALRKGKPCDLSQAIPLLRKQGLIGLTEKVKAWALRLPSDFRLLPVGQPNTLQYLPRSPGKPAGVPAAAAPQRAVGSVAGMKTPRSKGQRALPVHWVPLRQALWQCMYQKVTVADVLRCVPELHAHPQWLSLTDVGGRLRAQGWLAPSHSALKILDRYPGHFELDLKRMPPSVRYRG